MKLFEVVIDDGHENVFKTKIASKSKKEMLSVYGGNGTFEKIKDVTMNYPIDEQYLKSVLTNSGYGQAEIALITALVEEHNDRQQRKGETV